MRAFFRQPVDDVMACLEPIVTVKRPLRSAAPLLITLIVAWFVYVPIHELLHVLGCVITGGSVTQLQIAPRYGGALLTRMFPFVVSGGDYAGRLSGFDWKGSDLIYLATDFMPYVLTVLIGIPLIKAAGRRRRPILFGVGIVLGLAPFYSLPGDYFEMGSIVTTRAVTVFRGGGHPPAFEGIRSDDVFKLWSEVFTKPAELGLTGTGEIALAAVLILVSMVMAVLLAFATYWLGHQVSKPLAGRAVARAGAPRIPRGRNRGGSWR